MNSGDAYNQLVKAQRASQNPQAIFQKQNQQLGVNAARDTVQGLRGAIDNTTRLLQSVAPSVMGRTAQSLVTSAQAGRQIQNESAPIQQTLTSQGNQYNEAQQRYSDLASQADRAAQLAYQGQQDKLSYLQNIYNTLYQREQDAKKAAAEERARKEQIRQFNAELAARRAESGGGGGISLGGLGSVGSSPSAQMQQRKGGGFNFQASSGRAINAAQFARAKGIPFRTLLSQMAKAGDRGAATALGYVGNDYGVNKSKLRNLLPSPSSYSATVRLLRALGARI